MQKKSNSFFLRILPFIALGIFIVILVVGLVVFSYLLIIGAIVGIILFGISWVYNKLTGRKRQKLNKKSPNSGRIIDSDFEKKP